jgi:putative FmdB family regulatory protein
LGFPLIKVILPCCILKSNFFLFGDSDLLKYFCVFIQEDYITGITAGKSRRVIMPIYEYLCRKCGNRFEELVSIHVQNPLPCPKCGSGDTEKLMSLIGGIHIGRKHESPGCPSASSCAESGSCPMQGCEN